MISKRPVSFCIIYPIFLFKVNIMIKFCYKVLLVEMRLQF